jgi:hypothetical protein
MLVLSMLVERSIILYTVGWSFDPVMKMYRKKDQLEMRVLL